MPLFKYKVAGKDGSVAETLVEGESRQDSLSRLRGRGMTPLEFLGQCDSSGKDGVSIPFFRKGVDICDFTNRLAPLLKAHIQLERAFGIMAEGLDDGPSKEMVVEFRRGLHEGRRLSAMIADRGGSFPGIYTALIEAGEESGALPEVMVELQRHLNARKELSDFLITSSIYPAIVLSVTSGVIILLFTVFIPKFSKIFSEMGKSLPLPTKIMLAIGDFTSAYWWVALLVLAALGAFVWSFRKDQRLKVAIESLSLKAPFLGELTVMTETSRYLRTLSILVSNHVHLLNAVRIAAKALSNSKIADSLSGVASDLRGGAKLSAALSKSPYFPKLAVQILGIGEESGRIGEMLDQVASRQEEELRLKIRRLLALFEPMVILLLSAIVLAVVISIFMAILEMNRI